MSRKHGDRSYFVAIGPPVEADFPPFEESASTQVEAEAELLTRGGHVERRCMQGCCSRVVARVPSVLERVRAME